MLLITFFSTHYKPLNLEWFPSWNVFYLSINFESKESIGRFHDCWTLPWTLVTQTKIILQAGLKRSGSIRLNDVFPISSSILTTIWCRDMYLLFNLYRSFSHFNPACFSWPFDAKSSCAWLVLFNVLESVRTWGPEAIFGTSQACWKEGSMIQSFETCHFFIDSSWMDIDINSILNKPDCYCSISYLIRMCPLSSIEELPQVTTSMIATDFSASAFLHNWTRKRKQYHC